MSMEEKQQLISRRLSISGSNGYGSNCECTDIVHNRWEPLPPNQEVFLKLILLGDSGVGKSSYMRRHLTNLFTENHPGTVGGNTLI